MKILMIDKFYFVKGGAERYFFELSHILEKNNHQVIPYSMIHKDNFDTPYDKYFVDNIDFNTSALQGILQSPKSFMRMFYSVQAKKRLEKLIQDTRPDIAHLHMIDHQLSPSILHALKKYNIPVIQTVHQYKLVCPNYRLYNMRTQTICEKCLSGAFYHPIFERCHKDSWAAGLMIALETGFHRMIKIYEKNIDLFHVPSRFMGKMLRCGGINKQHIEHLYYTINIDDYPVNSSAEDYFVYYGRLAKEKGIMTLLKSMERVPISHLMIIGNGPQRQALESFVERRKLHNVTFLGIKGGSELKSLVSKSKFVVVPSEWYDNSPLVIYESFAMGKPVIGTQLGGIPELVDHETNGWIYEAGNSDQLSDILQYALKHPKIIKQFGMKAREKAEKEFSPSFHYSEIMKKYDRLLGKI